MAELGEPDNQGSNTTLNTEPGGQGENSFDNVKAVPGPGCTEVVILPLHKSQGRAGQEVTM